MVRNIQRSRVLIQSLWTIITNSHFAGFVNGKIYTGKLKYICVPGLNCYSCPGSLGSCPIGSLQAVIGSAKYKFSFYLVGFFLIIGTLFGRFICGFLCPFGFIQDLLFKIPFVNKIKTFKGDSVLRYLKYVILLVFVILLPMTVVDVIGGGSPWFCKYICPAGTLEGGIPLILTNPFLRNSLGFLFAWKTFILTVIIVLSVILYRPFCKYICPLGAIYGFFNSVSIYHHSVNKSKCTSCDTCTKSCGMHIKPHIQVNHRECIRCGKCKEACVSGAISSGFYINK